MISILQSETVSLAGISSLVLNLITPALFVGGLVIFFKWFYETRLGTTALENAKPRLTNMPPHVPIFVIGIWLLSSIVFSSITDRFAGNLAEHQKIFLDFSVIVSVEIFLIGVIIVSARRYFTEKLYGFGLRFDKWRKDLSKATLCFLAVWPFVTMMLLLTVKIGERLVGAEFEMSQNEGLRIILEYDSLPLRVLMIVFAVCVTPIFEEFVFRGLLQSYMRNMGFGPWQTILFVSILFTILHPLMHFPALITLAICLGYAYEKSNSILRPIFIHILFNGVSVTLALLNAT